MKSILVTGCTSGFGKLAVLRLLGRGHRVIAALRGGEARLHTVFERHVWDRHQGQLFALDLHMERPETFGQAAQLVQERFGGKLDVLINNAGFGLYSSLEDMTEQQLRYQMEVNFFGPALLTRALLPQLRTARGRVLNISSVCGRHGLPFYTAYTASKFALEGLTESMRHELKPYGVQVSLIEPGGFKTEFAQKSQFGDGSFKGIYTARTEALDRFIGASAARLGNPDRVARLIERYAVDKRRLPLRRAIGPDARLLVIMHWLLPERLASWLIEMAFRFAVFREIF